MQTFIFIGLLVAAVLNIFLTALYFFPPLSRLLSSIDSGDGAGTLFVMLLGTAIATVATLALLAWAGWSAVHGTFPQRLLIPLIITLVSAGFPAFYLASLGGEIITDRYQRGISDSATASSMKLILALPEVQAEASASVEREGGSMIRLSGSNSFGSTFQVTFASQKTTFIPFSVYLVSDRGEVYELLESVKDFYPDLPQSFYPTLIAWKNNEGFEEIEMVLDSSNPDVVIIAGGSRDASGNLRLERRRFSLSQGAILSAEPILPR